MIAFVATFITIVFALLDPRQADHLAVPVFMATIVVLGLPHGMVDPVLLCSRKLSCRWLGISSRTLWIGVYLGVAAGYVFFWRSAPGPGVILFLMLTLVHWGTSEYSRCDRSAGRWFGLGLTRGAIVVVGVLALQPESSMAAIAMVSGDDVALPVASLRGVLGVVVLVHFGFLFSENRGNWPGFFRRAWDSLLILILLALTPALLGMAVYYTFFHAERYYRIFDGDSRMLLLLTHVICFCLVVGGALFFRTVEWFSPQSLAVHFQYLAAFTLPHTLLVWHLQHREMNGSVSPPNLVTI